MASLALPFAAPAPVPTVQLRPYQTQSVGQVLRLVREGVRRILLVAPTGAGKTVCLAALAVDAIRRDQCVLVLAHRRELINQTVDKLEAASVPLDHIGVVMAGDRRRNPGAPVQVASVDTLRNWIGRRGLPLANWVIIDEAHRSAAQSYRSIADAYPEATILGLTATPWRLDGQGLKDLFDEAVVVATMRELIDQGFLVPLRCYSHPTRPNLSGVKIRGGEFAEEEIAQVMRSSLLLGSIPEQYKARADGRAAFGFAVNVEHAHELARVCSEAGIPAVAVSGETDTDERARALDELRSGRVRIVWNCQLFTEGTDVPEVKAIILARPTLSRTLAFQMIGRGMRPCSSTGFGDCIVLDHAGVLPIHGHPLEPQDYSLTSTRKRATVGKSMVKECPVCGELVALGAVLCACGHAWERAERTAPTQVNGQLVEHTPRPPVILSPSAEEQMCRAALRKAIDQGAKQPIPYARSILERQLRRSPDKAIFERVAMQLFAKPKNVEPPPMPGWLRKSLGIPEPAPVIPSETIPEPEIPFTSDEEIVEVAF